MQKKTELQQSFNGAQNLKMDSLSSLLGGSSSSQEISLSQPNLSQSDVSQQEQPETSQTAPNQSTIEHKSDTQPDHQSIDSSSVPAKRQDTIISASQSSFVLPPPPNLWWLNVLVFQITFPIFFHQKSSQG